MTEHDDQFDRRVRELLAMAQDDAPEPDEAHTSPRRATSSLPLRLALVAAALILVVVAVAVLGGRGSDRAVPADSTGATSSSTAASTTIPVDPVTCLTNLSVPYEETGTIHTVVPSNQALDIEVQVLDGPWCPGGTGNVRLTATNIGSAQETLDPIQLVLSAGMEKYPLSLRTVGDEPGGLSIAPDTGLSVDLLVAVPAVPPGSYSLYVYGFDASAALTVAGPDVCTTTDLVSQVVESGIAGNDTNQTLTDAYQVARVTNRSDEPCVLLQPTWVAGLRFGEDSGTVGVLPGPGVQTVRPVPLADFLLEPDESADLVLTMPRGCDSDRVVYDMIDVHLGVGATDPDQHWISVGQDVEVTCGLAVSDWLEPTPRT
ncbi:MAG: hypothetical protein RL238_2787 [Actinomycetota bacterium]|jgi:hypothetical protein